MTSFLPLSGYATYAGTKHGVRAFHHSVAIEERHGPEDIAEVIIDAIVSKPVEVVFPAVAGRFQRIVGVLPQLMHWPIPRVEASGRRKQRPPDGHASITTGQHRGAGE